MKILLVYPQYPETFWSFSHALKFVAKKAAFPPLGLLTVAAMLPGPWEKKLVDMNVTRLADADIAWADYVFISAMAVQRASAAEVVQRCRQLGVKTVGGGPMFTMEPEEFPDLDHLVLGEAEAILPEFLKDLAAGNARRQYLSKEHPDISRTPIPLWSLINMKYYQSMNVQYSRGCPYNCEFCDIILLNGHRPRTKSREQMLAELEAVYQRGWRGSVFIVDDNFIGNKRKLKAEILPAVIGWQEKKKHPLTLFTEASINLADDDELLGLMVAAGFNTVFIGIETPNEESLVECNKRQNQGRDLVAAVKKLQSSGLEVQGGFIVGFDSDPLAIFRNQINFIQKSGIVTAMVGLLNAPPGTRLYQRMEKEHRLVQRFSGDNTDFSLNFVPKMKYETLIQGYRQILATIYSPKYYYERVRTFLEAYQPRRRFAGKLQSHHIRAFLRSIWVLGVVEKGRKYYWRLFLITLFRSPRKFPMSITMSVYGYHFRKVMEKYLRTPVANMMGSEWDRK